MNMYIELICPVCHMTLSRTESAMECPRCDQRYEVLEGIPILIPPQIDQLSLDESKYHDEFKEDPAEVHQLNTLRNKFYHGLIRKEILRDGACILEVGGGSGHDARELIKTNNIHLVETDISAQTLVRSQQALTDQKHVKSGSIQFICCSMTALPFTSETFDVTFCIAAIHHLSNVIEGLEEMRRVTKPNGKVIIGLEPNRFYFRWLKKFRGNLSRITHTSTDNVSQADVQMEGYSEKEIRSYCELAGLRVIDVVPAWFALGILHYALEFAFRTFRLKRRIKIPLFLESMLLHFDRFLFLLPKMNYICWHWTVFAIRP